MDQLSVAAYVRLQLQNMADELRGTTQTCTARSIERSPRSGCACMVKVRKFSSQIPLPQTTRWRNGNVERQFITFLRSEQGHFWRVPLSFWEIVCFLLTWSYHTIILLCIRQLTLSQKALHHTLRCPFYSTLDVKSLHIHSYWTLFLAVNTSNRSCFKWKL